ncbi:zinc finger and SCAN domain-containing protein 22-like [Aedes albopictus]|uniref:C2H2-type domain-containing protein n=1 Tax=Aedes albopictus TaxID=7160 RepID=A0ABM2A0T1_AEDAL
MDISGIKTEPLQPVEIDQNLLDDLLAYKSKPSKPKPIKAGFVCALCLRRCPPKSVVKFASCTNSKAVDPTEAKQKLRHALGLELEVEKHTTCLTCWRLVKLIGDFKLCCRKAIGKLEAVPTGLDSRREDDAWMSEATLDWIVHNCKVIWKQIELIDAQAGASYGETVECVPERLAVPMEQIFIVPDVMAKEYQTDDVVMREGDGRQISKVPDLLKRLPKDLVIKRTTSHPSEKIDLVSSIVDIKNEVLESEQEYGQDEMMDDEGNNFVDEDISEEKVIMSSKTTKRKSRDQMHGSLEDILNIMNTSKFIADDEAAVLDFLATKTGSTTAVLKTDIPVRNKSSRSKQKAKVVKTVRGKAEKMKKPAIAAKGKSGEVVTCVKSGKEMLHFLTTKPETSKNFTKRGVLNKEHQVQVKNLYEVLDVLSTTKISSEDQVVALDLLATKAKIANPRKKEPPKIRPAVVNELSDAALDEYMASVDEKIVNTSRKKSTAAEEALLLEVDHYKVTICTCDICGRNFDGQHAVNVHKMRCKPECPANEKYVSCPICTATFLDNSGLTFHINRHKGIRPYKCRKFCDSTFFSNFTRMKHERNFCEREGRICSICGMQLKNEGRLTAHLKTVHGEAKFECSVCGMKFRCKRNFNDHKMVHTDERKYACPQCDKTFKRKRSLKVHKRIHTNQLPYGCHLCEQTFNYKVSLHSHIERQHGP